MQDITKFDPNVEKLTALVAESAGIVEVDLNDPMQIESVKKARIKLRDARVLIEKTGKQYREDALQYQRDVIAKERSLIAIIEPEEERLKAFEQEAKTQKEMAIRRDQLPSRMERLTNAGLTMTEDEVMALDSEAFEHKFNELVAQKNESVRLENERKERELREAAERVVKERVDARKDRLMALGFHFNHRTVSMTYEDIEVTYAELESEDAAAWDGVIARVTPMIESRKKLAADKAERERQEGEERARVQERERIEREAKEKGEREAREKAEVEAKKAYQKFLSDNGVTAKNLKDFKQEHTPDGVILWKRVAVFKAK